MLLLPLQIYCPLFQLIKSSSTLEGATIALLWRVALRRRRPFFRGKFVAVVAYGHTFPFPKKVEKNLGHQSAVGWYVGELFFLLVTFFTKKIPRGATVMQNVDAPPSCWRHWVSHLVRKRKKLERINMISQEMGIMLILALRLFHIGILKKWDIYKETG